MNGLACCASDAHTCTLSCHGLVCSSAPDVAYSTPCWLPIVSRACNAVSTQRQAAAHTGAFASGFVSDLKLQGHQGCFRVSQQVRFRQDGMSSSTAAGSGEEATDRAATGERIKHKGGAASGKQKGLAGGQEQVPEQAAWAGMQRSVPPLGRGSCRHAAGALLERHRSRVGRWLLRGRILHLQSLRVGLRGQVGQWRGEQAAACLVERCGCEFCQQGGTNKAHAALPCCLCHMPHHSTAEPMPTSRQHSALTTCCLTGGAAAEAAATGAPLVR